MMPAIVDQAAARNIRVILFDAVGTLIRVRGSVAEVYGEVGRRCGSRLTTAEIEARFLATLARQTFLEPTSQERERQRWREIVADVLWDIDHSDEAAFAELWEVFGEPEQWAVFEDVAATWRELERRGYLVGIASNFDQRLPVIVRSLPPLDRARHCFASAAVGYSKPHRAFFQAIEEKLQVSGPEVLLVGDSAEHDVAGAQGAGWHVVQIARGGAGTNGSHASHPRVADLRELLDLLP